MYNKILHKLVNKLAILFFILLNNEYALCVPHYDPLCGPRCLFEICKNNKIKITLEEICKLTEWNSSDGVSMYNLYLIAKQKQLHPIPIKCSFNKLCSFKHPSIVYVNNSHFLLFHGCKDNKVIIQDPPFTEYVVTKDEFLKKWQGEALIFSKKIEKKLSSSISKSTTPPIGPRIHFSRTSYYAGIVEEGMKLSYSFTLRNIGTETLELSSRSTCGCTSAFIPEKMIPSGGNGVIKIELDTKGMNGNIKQGAYIRTNDPENQMIKITLETTIKSSVKIIPYRIWLGEIHLNEELTREVHIINSGNIKIKDIKTPEGISAKILPEKKENISYIPIQITINVNNIPGKYERQITIHTNDKSKSEMLVFVSGKVVGEAKAFPSMIFFGEIKPYELSEKKTIIIPDKFDKNNFININTAVQLKVE